MKDIPKQKGRRYISQLIAEGEHERQDFKFAISDARKIARSISAFSNAVGGRLLIGVKDNGTVAGVRNEEDIYMVEQAAQRYCKPAVEVDFRAFSYDANQIVIRASIPQSQQRPVRCQEADGTWRAYYRVDDENIVAHPLMVRIWQTDGLSFSLTEEVGRLMELLDANPDGLDVEDVARGLGISKRKAEDMVVGMASVGVISFSYRAPSFRIVRSNALPDSYN